MPFCKEFVPEGLRVVTDEVLDGAKLSDENFDKFECADYMIGNLILDRCSNNFSLRFKSLSDLLGATW